MTHSGATIGVEGWHDAPLVQAATRGRWVRTPSGSARFVRIDSREIQPGDAFVALRGEHADGHAFLAQAAARGAAFAVIDDQSAAGDLASLPEGFGVLLVDSAMDALREWACAHRDRLIGTRVVAVAGSAGKTTTVRLIDAALRTQLSGTHAPKSFNNHLGVAVTLLGASPRDGYVVCEVGTSGPGETAALSAIVRPDVAVLTSLGREHLEGLGSLEGVAKEAAAITVGLHVDGSLILPEDALLPRETRGVIDALTEGPWRRVRFGASDSCDVRAEVVAQGWAGVRARLAGREVMLPMPGAHNALNAAAAIGVARELGLDEAQACDGLASAQGPPMRLERLELRGVRVLHDAYNAHPDSVRAALVTLAGIDPAPGGRRVAVLGEMLELGTLADAEHRGLGAWLVGAGGGSCDLVVTLGRRAALVGEGLGGARGAGIAEHRAIEPTNGGRASDAACAAAAGLLRAGDVALVKGSRGAGLERVVDALRG